MKIFICLLILLSPVLIAAESYSPDKIDFSMAKFCHETCGIHGSSYRQGTFIATDHHLLTLQKQDKLHVSLKNQMAKIKMGVKHYYPFCNCFALYLNSAITFGRLRLKGETIESDESLSKALYGGAAKAGLYYYLSDSAFIDLFLDYRYSPTSMQYQEGSAIKPGVGIGISY